MSEPESVSVNFRLHREIGGIQGVWSKIHRRWWFRILAWLMLLAGIGAGLLWFMFARDLPSVDQLRKYEPPLPTYVRDNEGEPIHAFARERRIELSYDEYPPLLVRAFMSAEDKTFFEHHGLDFPGLIRAAVEGLVSGSKPRGTSTITQQVAKNLLIGNASTYSRKAKEAILAWRIEDTLTKQQIMELYLNQIALGRNAFGVGAAANAYFDKDLKQLTLPQMAYLAALPKGPANYDPERHGQRAIERRNWILGEMLKNGFINKAQHDAAVAAPLGTTPRRTPKFERNQTGGYFIEAVRRQLLDKFGETDKDGPYSVYAGGLWVRTSLDPDLQSYAEQALRDGLVRYDRGRGWSGPLRKVKISGDNWFGALLNTNVGIDYEDWQPAIVISKQGSSAELGFTNGKTGTMSRGQALMPVRGKGGTTFDALNVGDIIAVAPDGKGWSLRTIPKVSGGMIVQQPHSGRILAMQGGFDSRIQSFNRAIQAHRQPGSTIKPLVYSAALEHGMTPATMIEDAPICFNQGAKLGKKCFRNFGHEGGSGMHTLRWGIEQSRNLMTVRAATETGMENVVDLLQRVGVSQQKYPPYPAFALGAGETTVMRMVNAYSILINHGRALNPTLIDYVQDRHGKVIWPDGWRACARCNMPDWDGKPMPRPKQRARQIIDPLTAYQMVHITEGVVQRGTATILRDLGRPMMGKTGTTTGPTDVWFIGGTPQMIGGVYIGYDTPRNLGGYAQGGTVAAPIFKQFAKKAYEGLPPIPFVAPQGIRMVRIDRQSGKPVFGSWPSGEPKAAVIWEAFKPESEPRRTAKADGDDAPVKAKPRPAADRPRETDKAQSDSDFLQRQGGIY